jgi:hypothetical protein
MFDGDFKEDLLKISVEFSGEPLEVPSTLK